MRKAASAGCIRIANTDQEIIAWTTYCLRQLEFRVRDRGSRPGERPDNASGSRGGLKEHLRFFLTIDPAITRKRSIEGTAIKSDARSGVAAIEPLGIDMPMYDITTGTGDFIANGVVSHNCFARPTHTYLDLDAGRDFEREIVVKVNVPEVLRAELAKPSWKREQVALGTNTDPYQWVESRYKLMPEIWQALLDFDTPCSLVTKSPLALRDIDILQDLAAGPGVTVFFSVPTLDEQRLARDRAAHPLPPRAAGGSAQDERGRRAERDPDRAADARHQRLARAGRRDPARSPRTPGRSAWPACRSTCGRA